MKQEAVISGWVFARWLSGTGKAPPTVSTPQGCVVSERKTRGKCVGEERKPGGNLQHQKWHSLGLVRYKYLLGSHSRFTCAGI